MECLMDHIVLNVEDDEKMITFYSKVLMFPPERLEEYRAGNVPFPSVRLNANTIIDLFPKKMWQKSARDGRRPREFEPLLYRLEQRGLAGTPGATSGQLRSDRRRTCSSVGVRTVPGPRSIFGTRKAISSRRGITRVQQFGEMSS